MVTATEDNDFNVVEEKKQRDNEKGDYRRREKQTMGNNVHKAKLVAQHGEDKIATRLTMQGP